MPNLSFGKFGMMLGNKLNTDIADIGHIIDSAMVFPFVFDTQLTEHLHHSIDFAFGFSHFEEIVFNINIALKVFF